jgi:predicted ATPase/DNA-binding winged helix-turn-helix (wHTH) protein
MSPAATLRFGRFELRQNEHRLLADGEPVALGGRAFDLLLALVQRPGELVTRNELIERVWPGRVVEENNLSVQINALRKVLGGEWLVTVPGRGYRFTGPASTPFAAAAATTAATETPSARAAEPAHVPRSHLPAQQALLIGRSADLAALGTLIEQHRLVTVVGAGGMGKTRLAQALLHMRANSYPQGVCWIELGGVTSPELLPGTVAQALGLQAAPGDAMAQLASAVAGLQMLLALDNAEHLLEAVAHLAQTLLDAAPGLHLVATSQAPLRLAHERVLRLGPLAIPQGPLPAVQAESFGAVGLFCDRAAAADHRFVLKDAEVPAVIELCRQLDGVALAIELAAARAPALGVEPLLALLSDRLRLLNNNRDRRAPARQQSLRAALAWSEALLLPAEQRLFRRLAVTVGSASLALIQRLGCMAAADEAHHAATEAWEVLDTLDQLVQRSLIEVQNDDELGAPRYRLLESPRALALERLAASDEEAAVRVCFAQGVLSEFAAAHAALHDGQIGLQQWQRRVEPERGNAREALAHAQRQSLPELELALATALMPMTLNEERLALAQRAERLLADAGAVQPLSGALVCRAWREISISWANTDLARSVAAARRALALARDLDATETLTARPEDGVDRFPLYDALCGLAHMLIEEYEGAPAESLLQEAQAIEDPRWPAVRLRVRLRVQASLATQRGQAPQALQLYRRLLDADADAAAGDAGLVTLLNLANAELVCGDAAAAVATGTRLVAQLLGRRNQNLLLFVRVNLAAAHLALGETGAARDLFHAVWGGAPVARMHAWCVDFLAQLAALEGRLDAAAQLIGAADARYAAIASPRQVNEQRAHERTLALIARAGSAPDGPAVVALRASGRMLADAEVAQLALAGR